MVLESTAEVAEPEQGGRNLEMLPRANSMRLGLEEEELDLGDIAELETYTPTVTTVLQDFCNASLKSQQGQGKTVVKLNAQLRAYGEKLAKFREEVSASDRSVQHQLSSSERSHTDASSRLEKLEAIVECLPVEFLKNADSEIRERALASQALADRLVDVEARCQNLGERAAASELRAEGLSEARVLAEKREAALQSRVELLENLNLAERVATIEGVQGEHATRLDALDAAVAALKAQTNDLVSMHEAMVEQMRYDYGKIKDMLGLLDATVTANHNQAQSWHAVAADDALVKELAAQLAALQTATADLKGGAHNTTENLGIIVARIEGVAKAVSTKPTTDEVTAMLRAFDPVVSGLSSLPGNELEADTADNNAPAVEQDGDTEIISSGSDAKLPLAAHVQDAVKTFQEERNSAEEEAAAAVAAAEAGGSSESGAGCAETLPRVLASLPLLWRRSAANARRVQQHQEQHQAARADLDASQASTAQLQALTAELNESVTELLGRPRVEDLVLPPPADLSGHVTRSDLAETMKKAEAETSEHLEMIRASLGNVQDEQEAAATREAEKWREREAAMEMRDKSVKWMVTELEKQLKSKVAGDALVKLRQAVLAEVQALIAEAHLRAGDGGAAAAEALRSFSERIESISAALDALKGETDDTAVDLRGQLAALERLVAKEAAAAAEGLSDLRGSLTRAEHRLTSRLEDDEAKRREALWAAVDARIDELVSDQATSEQFQRLRRDLADLARRLDGVSATSAQEGERAAELADRLARVDDALRRLQEEVPTKAAADKLRALEKLVHQLVLNAARGDAGDASFMFSNKQGELWKCLSCNKEPVALTGDVPPPEHAPHPAVRPYSAARPRSTSPATSPLRARPGSSAGVRGAPTPSTPVGVQGFASTPSTALSHDNEARRVGERASSARASKHLPGISSSSSTGNVHGIGPMVGHARSPAAGGGFNVPPPPPGSTLVDSQPIRGLAPAGSTPLVNSRQSVDASSEAQRTRSQGFRATGRVR